MKEFSDTILYNVDAYIILVDRNFLVEKTNYYNLNNTSEGQVLRRVGELLRCKNGLDAGACGSHENCKVCPVRNSIEKCFREKGHFSPLETPMRLYMSEKMDNYVDCIVCVSGTYLQLDQDDKVLLTVRDVTRQKKILDELEEARRNAEWAGEQKTAFLANMSHEIRTPLNAIVGFAGLLGTASDQDRISYVEIIKGNTNMLLQLVNDILDMSKIEAGTLEFIYTDVDVNQIMRELEGIFRLRLEEADVPVRIIFEPKLPVCFIHTEKNRISQVISNFLSNAFKYTDEGKSITVTLKQIGKKLLLQVKDTGSGIPVEKLNNVFGRFEKLDLLKQGFGLGLSICKSILDKMGGKIWEESELGVGTCYYFSIPYNGTFTVVGEQNKPLILVAEDMDCNYELVKAILEERYSVLRANDGIDVVTKYESHKPDLILMDVRMPGLDGLSAAGIIRELNPTIPIIATTAFAFETDRGMALAAGCNEYMSKPLEAEKLKTMIERCLENKL